MLHRRPGTGASSGPSGSSSTAPSVTGAGNTAYTPLKRRESAGLYPAPSSGSKARYPLPSPGLTGYSASPHGGNVLGLSSPISGGGQGYGTGGGGGGQYARNTFDLGVGGGEGSGGVKGNLKEVVLGTARRGIERWRRGVGDAMRLDRSWNLAWNDAELRLLIFKSSMINLLSLLLLSFFSIVVSPSLGPALSDSKSTKEIGMWYNLLLSWPVFAVCFWVNLGSRYISPRSDPLTSLVSFSARPRYRTSSSQIRYRHQPSPSSTPIKSSHSTHAVSSDPSTFMAPLFKGVARVTMIADFTLMSRLISFTPVVGRFLAFIYMCIITGYYCFEWNFASKGWSLDARVAYVQERTAYMIGFGLFATFITSLSTPLINMSIFALLYPFFVIQALVSRPPGLSSGLASPGASLPSTPTTEGINPFFSERGGQAGWRERVYSGGVPLFVGARYGLEVLGWFEVALGRKLGGSGRRERPGKRLG